jgi:anti-sigma factor RsiW
MSNTGYKLGVDFPREGFVQVALERHFESCERLEADHADFACIDENGRRWVIEAKGETNQVGLDFRTGLGQLLQNMEDRDAHYAVAIPDTPKFAGQRARVPAWVRSALGFHWMIVGESGAVSVVPPEDE